jgi:tetratricopeptide (TPR) repeat protein
MTAVLSSEGRIAEAGAHVDRVLAMDPTNLRARILKAALLETAGDHAASIVVAQGVLLEIPGHVPSLVHLGNNHRMLGQVPDAITAYRQALALDPANGHAWLGLANLKNYRFAPEELHALAQQAERADLPELTRGQLAFAAGQALLDRDEIEPAYRQLERANALFRKLAPRDPDEQQSVMLGWTERSMAFARTLPMGAGEEVGDDFRPVFIIGLPRSGTTLLEQMLAAHPQVEATDELAYVPMLAKRFVDCGGLPRVEELPILAAEYRRSVGFHRRTQRPVVLDKRLENFWHTGFIQAILPTARFIDVRRHPLASVVAMFKQSFATTAIGFSGSPEELARLRRSYLMAVQRLEEAFPERVLRVHYERLVEDTEAELRRVLAFLELPFEPNCLRWHESGHPVRTPSAQQVRQPIFSHTLHEWKRFEPYLDGARAALAAELESYPT